jgi:Flp pilus assembly pilin Flp
MIARLSTWMRDKRRAIAGDESGATLTEFGLVVPILVTLVVGIFDLAHTQYTTSLVNGAMQKAGRDLTLETATGSEATIDQTVVDAVSAVTPRDATVTLAKLAHFDFGDIGEPEPYTDENSNLVCDNNEVFEDSNGNGSWDDDRGASGIGGARDAVVYTATVSYPRMFPMAGILGLPETVTLEASTILRNQPYDTQETEVTTGNCV